jgi:flavodoxin
MTKKASYGIIETIGCFVMARSYRHIQQYDTILIGYPNWWASIPMPIATFLESYDLSGKTIIPFCSHGGGRFGRSLTAIAKLAPNSVIGEGLSVHYSGGSTLDDDITAWLKENGIQHRGAE